MSHLAQFDPASLDDAMARRNKKRQRRQRAAWRQSLLNVSRTRAVFVQALADGKSHEQATQEFNAHLEATGHMPVVVRPVARRSAHTAIDAAAGAIARVAAHVHSNEPAQPAPAAAPQSAAELSPKSITQSAAPPSRQPARPRKPKRAAAAGTRTRAEPVAAAKVEATADVRADLPLPVGAPRPAAAPAAPTPAPEPAVLAQASIVPPPKRASVFDDEVTDPDEM